jgi:hypothetical protein
MALLPRLRPALNLSARFCSSKYSRLTCRNLHLAPPYLLDDYIPRYHLLSSVDASKKRSLAYAHLRECNLCPRLCGVNRYEKTGVCLIGAETVKVNTIAPHFGEGMSHSKIDYACNLCMSTDRLQSRVFKDTMEAEASSSLDATCVAPFAKTTTLLTSAMALTSLPRSLPSGT